LPFDEAGFDEVGHDPLRRALRDAHHQGDVSKAGVGVTRNAEQDLRVVRDEAPRFLVPGA
jgi:hypothetical protein